MDTQSASIIIVGAGPTGLMLANQLTRFDIDYIILDQKTGPTDQSRALVVQARSMEIYEQLGLSDQIVANGQKNDGITLYKNGHQSASVTIVNPDEDSTPFPFLMMYEQSKNETLLYNNLQVQNREVQWNTGITSIQQSSNLYTLEARRGDDDITYQCTYLIACDGSKSTVRDFSQVPFTGGSYINVFFVADTLVEGPFSSKKLSLFLHNKGINMLFPMIGEKHFRVLGTLPAKYYHQDNIPFETILNEVKDQMYMPVTFHDTRWHSTYRLHHKKVARFSKGNIFFAGDAAHVHSPAGGQGMNTGLQDAYNLAWKLALVHKGKAAPSLLNSYHEERNPVAMNLLKTTDKLFAVMSSGSFWHSVFRLHVISGLLKLVMTSETVRKLAFMQISQLKINYALSSLAKGKARKIKAGSRVPHCLLKLNNAQTSLYKLINETSSTPFTVLVYNQSASGFEQLDATLFTLLSVEVTDNNNKVFKRRGLPPSFVMVIRPDNYIGYISDKAGFNDIQDFFTSAYLLL